MVHADDSPSLALSPWLSDRRAIVAQSAMPNDAIEVALNGIVKSYRDDEADLSTDGTVALSFQAEGSDLTALVQGLGGALIDDVDHSHYDVRSVQFNSFVRTETGFAGWGYAHAVERGVAQRALTVEDVSIESSLHSTTIRMFVKRNVSG